MMINTTSTVSCQPSSCVPTEHEAQQQTPKKRKNQSLQFDCVFRRRPTAHTHIYIYIYVYPYIYTTHEICMYIYILYIERDTERERKRKRELVKEGGREIEGETATDVFRIWGNN